MTGGRTEGTQEANKEEAFVSKQRKLSKIKSGT